MGGAIHGLTGSGTLKAAGSGGSHTSWLPLEVSLCVIAPEDGDTIQLLQFLNLDSRGDSMAFGTMSLDWGSNFDLSYAEASRFLD